MPAFFVFHVSKYRPIREKQPNAGKPLIGQVPRKNWWILNHKRKGRQRFVNYMTAKSFVL
jgi:hypothetical protein